MTTREEDGEGGDAAAASPLDTPEAVMRDPILYSDMHCGDAESAAADVDDVFDDREVYSHAMGFDDALEVPVVSLNP